MRIAVMGTGGVGGYFGARLAQGGHEVAFVARGRHLAAMRERADGRAVRHHCAGQCDDLRGTQAALRGQRPLNATPPETPACDSCSSG